MIDITAVQCDVFLLVYLQAVVLPEDKYIKVGFLCTIHPVGSIRIYGHDGVGLLVLVGLG